MTVTWSASILALSFAWFPNTGVVQHRAAHNEKCLTKTQVTHSNQFAVTAQTCELRCRGRDGGHKAFRWTAGDCSVSTAKYRDVFGYGMVRKATFARKF